MQLMCGFDHMNTYITSDYNLLLLSSKQINKEITPKLHIYVKQRINVNIQLSV